MAAGYTVNPTTVFTVSVQFLDTKNFVYGIAEGTAGDLASSAGMAGNDATAQSFAARYEPCARTVVQAMGTAGQAMAAISGRLLTMAWNYLSAEDHIAASFNGGVIDTASGMRQQPDCEPSEAYAALPAVTGAQETTSIPVIGRFWPQGSPDKLRAAAQVWLKAAQLIDEAQVNGANQETPILTNCSGDAVTAFQKYAATVFTSSPGGGKTVATSLPLMENISAGCRQLADACNQYADQIDKLRSVITHLAIAAGIITAAGLLGTIVTVGLSDEASAAADAALVADAAAATEAFQAAEAASIAATSIAEAETVVAEAASSINVTVARAAAIAATATVTKLAAAPLTTPTGGPAGPIGPIGPRTPPAFPLYSPAQQAAAAAWAGTLPTRPANYGNAADQAYQVRVAGNQELLMSGANGTTVWADGFRPADGAIIDAKNVRELDCSPRSLNGLQQQNFATNLLSGKDTNELARYGDAIGNPANQAQFVELDTNDPATVGYWQFLAAQQHVPSDVRYVP